MSCRWALSQVHRAAAPMDPATTERLPARTSWVPIAACPTAPVSFYAQDVRRNCSAPGTACSASARWLRSATRCMAGWQRCHLRVGPHTPVRGPGRPVERLRTLADGQKDYLTRRHGRGLHQGIALDRRVPVGDGTVRRLAEPDPRQRRDRPSPGPTRRGRARCRSGTRGPHTGR
jgi:hypothetical protein